VKAAAYARYSTDDQKASSVDDQLALLRREAPRFGATITAEYRDEAVSGATPDRPGYRALIAAARRREFDAIIVEDQSRLWRDQAEMHAALKHLRFLGIRVFSVAAGELTGETGKMVATIAGLKAELDLDETRRRVQRSLRGRIERGFSAGGPTYGYRSQPVYNGRQDRYGQPEVEGYRTVIYEPEARVVRRIFEMYTAGMSAKRIVLQLNAEGVAPPRSRRGRKTAGWDWTTIQGSRKRGTGILNNELYRGVRVWNRHEKVRNPENGNKPTMRLRPPEEWVRIPAPELRIVSDDLWNAVKARQEEATKASHGRPGGPRPKHLFSGLLRCGRCGARYVMLNGTAYGCSFNADRGPRVCDNSRRVRRDRLETALLAAIEEQIFTPANVAYLQRQVDAALRRIRSQEAPGRKALERQLRQAEEERERVKEALRTGKGGVALPILVEMLAEAEAKVRSLRGQLSAGAEAAADTIRAIPGLVEKALRNLRSVLERDTDRARTLLAGLLGEIILRPDEQGLVAEVQGNLSGVLVGATGSGGRI